MKSGRSRVPHRHQHRERKELVMAKMLIDSLLAAFEPEKYHDAYRENLMAMIQAKVEGKQIVETV